MVENRSIDPPKHEKRDELYAKVLDLRDLISYQDGTVASRTLINKKAGTMTIFSFDAGEGLSEHTAPYDAVVTILEGEGEFQIADEAFHLKAGETIILPANKMHALSAKTRFKMLLTMIRE